MRELTTRQRQALDFIRSFTRIRRIPPTMRDIGRALGIGSTNGVNDHLRALERKGYIVRDELISRSIRLTSLADQLYAHGPTCPRCGQALP